MRPVARLRTPSVRSFVPWIAAAATLSIWVSGAVLAPPAQAFSPAPHTRFPNLKRNDYVGKPLRIVTVVPDDGKPGVTGTFDSRMIWFGYALARSTWYKDMSAAYQLGAQGVTLHIRVQNMPVVDGTLTIPELEADLRNWMAAAGIGAAPSDRTIFVIHILCVAGAKLSIGTCGALGAGFHTGLTVAPLDAQFTKGDAMAIDMMHGVRPVDSATVVDSHEIIEAATDTGKGWSLGSLNPSLPFDVPPLTFIDGNARAHTEVADVASGARIREQFDHGVNSYDYEYQRIWTKASSEANGDPFEPPSDIPYASVSTPSSDWVEVSLSTGGSVQIPVTAWSLAPVSSWKISTRATNWFLKNGSPRGPDPCSFSLTGHTVNNGTVVHLNVSATGSAIPLSWCALRIESTTPDPDGVNHDSVRSWMVGIEFTS